MRDYFGYRFWMTAAISVLFAGLWIYISLPDADTPQTTYNHFAALTVWLAALLIGLVWHRWVGLVLRTRIEKIPYILYTCAGWGAVFYTGVQGYELYILHDALSSNDLYWGLGLYLLVPMCLAFCGPFYVYVKEWLAEVSFVQQFSEGGGGSAKWGTVRAMSRLGAQLKQSLLSLSFFKDQGVRSGRIILGQATFADHPFVPFVGMNDDSNLITTGVIGSGKSISAIWLTLLSYFGSVFVYDPSGEHTLMTFERRCSDAYLKSRGIISNVKKHFKTGVGIILDPFGLTPYPSNYYSLLSEINPFAPDAREIVEAIVDGLVLPEGPQNRYWEDLTRSFLQGLICHVLTTQPPEHHTLPFCLDLLYGVDPELAIVDPARFKDLLTDMYANPAMGGLAQQAARDLHEAGEKQYGYVLTGVANSLRWCGDEHMRRHLSKSDFSLKDFGLQKTDDGKPIIQTLYEILPDARQHDMSRWLRALASLSIAFMKQRKKENIPKVPTLFIMDEFAALGTSLKSISDGYATLRKYGVRLWVFLQSIQQLQTMFNTRWKDMLGQSNVQVLATGMGDPETDKYVSERLGRRIIRRYQRGRGFFGGLRKRIISETSRELLTPSEVATKLSKTEDAQIVFGSLSKHPLRLRQISFKRLNIRGTIYKSIGLSAFRGHIPPKGYVPKIQAPALPAAQDHVLPERSQSSSSDTTLSDERDAA